METGGRKSISQEYDKEGSQISRRITKRKWCLENRGKSNFQKERVGQAYQLSLRIQVRQGHKIELAVMWR